MPKKMHRVFDFDENMRPSQGNADGLKWYDGKSPCLGLCGTDASEEKGYVRLTEAERDYIRPVNDGEAWFGEHSAGLQLRFETDSARLFLRAKLRSPFDMTNMTQIGQCGSDVYVYDEEMKAFVLHEVVRFPFDAAEYECPVGHFAGSARKMRKYIVYFPLYMAADEFSVGLDKDATVKAFGFGNPLRIGIYGTSITHGCSASRPGMAYSNILSRMLGCEVLNFGFSGVAFAEKEMGELLGQRKLDILAVDVEPNAGVDNRLKDNAEDFLRAFYKKNPTAVVVLFSRILFALDRYDEFRIRLHAFYNGFLDGLARRFRRKGYRAYFADGSKILKDNYTEYTADGVHPDDIGMLALARAYQKKITEIMKRR